METLQDLLSDLPLCIKRGPYIKYKNFPETVNKVMNILKSFANADIKEICIRTGFKERAMYNWKKRLFKDRNYDPLEKQKRISSRIFTEEEEDGIADYIFTEKIIQNKCFNDEDCVTILTQAYLEKHANDKDFDYTYAVSKGFIYDFKIRHGFVSRLCHLKRRPAIIQSKIKDFINEIRILFDTIPLDRIINVDETAIFIAPKNLKIWHSKGKDDVINPVKFNEKDRITAVCGVAANGAKLNIQFIAKGETDIVLGSQIGDVSPHMRAYSKKGWTTIETFYEYLNYIKSLSVLRH